MRECFWTTAILHIFKINLITYIFVGEYLESFTTMYHPVQVTENLIMQMSL